MPLTKHVALKTAGLLVFNGAPDFEKTQCFGQDGYWIRIQDISNGYNGAKKENLPLVEGLFINSVKAWTLRTNVEEYITLENFESSAEFQLLNYPVYNEQVWVNESGTLSKSEEISLEKEGRLRITNDNDLQAQTWVLWERTESFNEKAGDEESICWIKVMAYLHFQPELITACLRRE